jgi:hypothetical protein
MKRFLLGSVPVMEQPFMRDVTTILTRGDP